MGQPTHCYDFNHLNSDITLTSGISESNFQTLLGNKINIDESDLVFISNNKVINLAGIVGSMSTSCSKNTKKVLIECAHFSPESIKEMIETQDDGVLSAPSRATRSLS